MIDLAHNINALFSETGENTGVCGQLSRLSELENMPHLIAVTPDLFYAAADAFPESEIRPMPLDPDGTIDLSGVSNVAESGPLFVISTANLETGVPTPVDELASFFHKHPESELITIDTTPVLADKDAARRLRDEMEAAILARFPFACLNGTAANRLPNVSNISFENMNGEVIASMLFEKGFSAATGCACADASKRPSITLREMNVPYSRVMGAMHFSFGDGFGKPEADSFIKGLTEVIEHVRRFSFE